MSKFAEDKIKRTNLILVQIVAVTLCLIGGAINNGYLLAAGVILAVINGMRA